MPHCDDGDVAQPDPDGALGPAWAAAPKGTADPVAELPIVSADVEGEIGIVMAKPEAQWNLTQLANAGSSSRPEGDSESAALRPHASGSGPLTVDARAPAAVLHSRVR